MIAEQQRHYQEQKITTAEDAEDAEGEAWAGSPAACRVFRGALITRRLEVDRWDRISRQIGFAGEGPAVNWLRAALVRRRFPFGADHFRRR
jgi:hypothetical protein